MRQKLELKEGVLMNIWEKFKKVSELVIRKLDLFFSLLDGHPFVTILICVLFLSVEFFLATVFRFWGWH